MGFLDKVIKRLSKGTNNWEDLRSISEETGIDFKKINKTNINTAQKEMLKELKRKNDKNAS